MKKTILVLGNNEDAMYHPLKGVDERLVNIFSDCNVICTTDTRELLKLDENIYHGVISYLDIWDSELDEEEARALYRYVSTGGALLILHNGISIQSREELKCMMGGSFVTHPAMTELEFVVKPHAITEDCTGFFMMEEPYQFDMVEDDKEVFLSYIYEGKEYVAGWSKCIGKGRLVFLMPGHTEKQFEKEEYVKLIRNSMQWCGFFNIKNA